MKRNKGKHAASLVVVEESKNKYRNLLFWIIFFIYEEIVLSAFTFGTIKSAGYALLFSVLPACIIHIVTSISLKEKFNYFVNYLILIIMCFVYIAQFVYYQVYESIFSFYSATNAAGQIWQFFPTIMSNALNKWYVIWLLLVPIVPIALLFSGKKLGFKRTNIKQKSFELILGLVAEVIAIVCILNINTDDAYSNKNLYFNVNYTTITTQKLGMFTAMRLDLQRFLFGFEEKTELAFNEENTEIEINKEIEYNALDIDWNQLIENESNDAIKNMYTYFSSQEPSKKNEYTGMFEGKNLAVFVCEAFTDMAINEELTPTLYKLYSEGFQFDNFYTPLYPVSTSDGEYITDTSLIPKEGVWSMTKIQDNYMPYSYANVFEQLGYSSQSYHDHLATYYNRDKYLKAMGYDSYLARGTGLEKRMNLSRWPSSDLEMIDVTTEDYLNENTGKFLAYYMTVSGHLEYTTIGNNMVKKNWDLVKDLEYSDKAKGYLAAQIELDRALELMIQRLEEAGELDNTVILISGDHYPYGLNLEEVNELSNFERDDTFEKHHSTALIWNNQMNGPIKIDKIGCSLDILPTMLNLFGIEFDSRLLMGRDLLSDSESLVIYSNRSFITPLGKYSNLTKKFEAFGELPEGFDENEYVTKMNNLVYNKFQISKLILENDLYRKMWTTLGWEIRD